MEAIIYSKGIHSKNTASTLIYVISRPLGWSLWSSYEYHEPPTGAFSATSVQHRTYSKPQTVIFQNQFFQVQ